MKYVVLMIILFLMPLLCAGVTRTVSLDGTQQYTLIQNAINDAVNGDVVLVHPGRYMENLDLSYKNSIILASLEYTTNDTTYISSTIIDGSSNNSTTVLCYPNTTNCTIRGFSITGGSGYDYFNGTSPWQIYGGGIFIYYNCSLSLLNLNIYGNKASCGGGISIHQSCALTMANVNIYNNIARYRGGGLLISSGIDTFPQIIFNQVNRCSIYNNFAQWGMDIDWYFIHGGSIAVYLKKFTVPQWEKYFADYYDSSYPPIPYTVFDVQETYLQPIDSDLYVSQTGNDNNSGLTPATALKTPSLAMQRIASNPANQHTVHLMAGEHHNIMRDEYIPIAIKDYTILQGVSQSQTRLYGQNLLSGTGVVTMGIERYGMTLKDLSITTSNASALFSWGLFDSLIENVTIENSTVGYSIAYLGYITSTFTLKNITMRNITAQNYDYGLHLTGSVIKLENILMQDNRVPYLPGGEFSRACGGLDIAVADTLIIRNSKFVNNTLYSDEGWSNFRAWTDPAQFNPYVLVDNCLFADNHTYNGARDIEISSMGEINIINSTFANNTTTYTDNLLVWADSTYIINSIFANNNAWYEIRADNTTLIENCLFTRTDNIWRTYDNQPALTWGQNNLVGTNPLFSGSDPTQPSYYYLFSDEVNGYSPAINAGTINSDILPSCYQIPEYDAVGNNRIFGDMIDIGCFESPGYTDIHEQEEHTPINNKVLIYPNPVYLNGSRGSYTFIEFTLPKKAKEPPVVEIYNLKGQKVRSITVSQSYNDMVRKAGLSKEVKTGGEFYSTVYDCKDMNSKKLASGIYIIKVIADGKQASSKITILK